MPAAVTADPAVGRAGAIGRTELYFALFLVATLNAFVEPATRQVAAAGLPRAAFDLFGISAILWLALAAGLTILAQGPVGSPWRRGDAPVAAGLVGAAALPSPVASGVALTLAASWAIATSAPASPLRRAAIIFLAMTGALVWGRLLLAVFGRPLLDLDALFVSQLLGSAHAGNMIWSEASGMRVIVAPGCSSMQGMSLTLVFWATVNQYFQVRFDRRAVLCCLAALAATVLVNVARIGALLNWPEHFEAFHTGRFYHLLMWVTLLLVVAICLFGARREIFRNP